MRFASCRSRYRGFRGENSETVEKKGKEAKREGFFTVRNLLLLRKGRLGESRV